MKRYMAMLSIVTASWLAADLQRRSAAATISLLSIDRGIRVDHQTHRNASPGVYEITRTIDSDIGRAVASLASTVEPNRLQATGRAGEYAAIGDDSFAVRAESFFRVAFRLTDICDFKLTGTLLGVTEAEHFISEMRLRGPAIDLRRTAYSAYRHDHLPLAETGTLGQGDYTFLLATSPTAYNPIGDPGSWAEGHFDVELQLLPVSPTNNDQVPEPGGLAVCLMLVVVGAGVRCRALKATVVAVS